VGRRRRLYHRGDRHQLHRLRRLQHPRRRRPRRTHQHAIAVFAVSASYEGRRKAVDRIATTIVTSTFVLACVPLISLLWLTVSKGGAAISGDLLTRTMLGMKGVLDQQYVAGEATLAGGFYHAIVGTVLITLAACIISIPIGVLTAIYLVEYSNKNRLGKAITFLVDVMTGIPSIVAGLFAFALFSTMANLLMPARRESRRPASPRPWPCRC
jgi:phosphate transport system permease protein